MPRVSASSKASASTTSAPEVTAPPVQTRAALAQSEADPGGDPAGFEQALTELERLVDRLETGDLGLEESLATFERGVHLVRGCQQALTAAEQRVRILTEPTAEAEPVAFAEGS